jgi:hypothetical protein
MVPELGKPCPDNLKQMCADLNHWAGEWETWGKQVKKIVDKCCKKGDPADEVPPPPKPPFK